MASQRKRAVGSIRVKYILNPGSLRDVEVEVGILSKGLDERIKARHAELRKEDPCAELYRVTYAGRSKMFEHWETRMRDPVWIELLPDERGEIPIKVLEHIR